MKTPHLILAISLSLAAGGVAAQATGSAQDVTQRLQAAGYTEVRDVELDDGLWEAEVRHADGRWHDVSVDPSNGDVMDDRSGQALMTAAQITNALQRAGYDGISDMDLDDAVWEVDALDRDGREVELKVNAHTGRVVHVEHDD